MFVNCFFTYVVLVFFTISFFRGGGKRVFHNSNNFILGQLSCKL